MREIYYLARSLLNREDYNQLFHSGIKSFKDLAQAGPVCLKEIISPETKIKCLLERTGNFNKEDKMSSQIDSRNVYTGGQTPASAGSLSFNPSTVELDGSYERERYLVRIDGFPLRLTGKSFKYLAKLAFSRLVNDEGWVYKDDIEIGFNQARYLYRLKQEMKTGGFSWPIFENNRLGYYRLDLEPSRIRLNLDNLKNHPDFELRRCAEELAPRMAV
jgi:hypothetical protein